MIINEYKKLEEHWVAFSIDRKTVVDKSKSMLELIKRMGNREDVVISYIERGDRFISP